MLRLPFFVFRKTSGYVTAVDDEARHTANGNLLTTAIFEQSDNEIFDLVAWGNEAGARMRRLLANKQLQLVTLYKIKVMPPRNCHSLPTLIFDVNTKISIHN